MLKDSTSQPLATVAYASVTSSKPKVELDSHADTCVVGNNCCVIHDHNRLVNAYSYDFKHGNNSAKPVDDAVVHHDSQSGQRFILMLNQAICIVK